MPHLRGDRGIALIGVLLMLAMLLALAATLALTVNVDTQLRGAYGQSVTGFYAAESGLNKAMAEFKNMFLDFRVPTSAELAPQSYVLSNRRVDFSLSERAGNPQSVTIPAGELFAGLNSIQYRYTVNSAATNVNTSYQEASVGAEFLVGNIPIFQFVAFYEDDLEILPGPEMHLHGRVHTNGDLYLNTNDKLFVEDNPPSGITTVQLSSRGSIYRGRKDTHDCSGTVTIDKLEDSVAPAADLDPRTLDCSGGTRAVPISEISLWKGSIVSEIQSISVPKPDIIAVGNGLFWKRADLRIALVVNQADQLAAGGPVLPHSIEVRDAAGLRDNARTAQLHAFMSDENFNANFGTMPGTMPIFYTDLPASGVGPAPTNAACNCRDDNPACGQNANNNCYFPAFAAADRVYSSNMTGNNQQPLAGTFDDDYRRGGYYNHREHKWMLLLNVNVTDLLRWNQSNGDPLFLSTDATDGGLIIFATVIGPASADINNYGVRVFGSANLPIAGGIGISADPTGLSVVTDQALYVTGDYNRAFNVGDLPKQPAALIGDSINILSNNYWRSNCTVACAVNDAQSVIDLSSPWKDAATVRINAAFLAGVDETGPGQFAGGYNGGLENYVRFHEDWSDPQQAMNYSGSLVSLGKPAHVNGTWAYGSPVYTAPLRNWDYDSAFNNAANLPPLTPRFVYVQQVLFTEDFQ